MSISQLVICYLNSKVVQLWVDVLELSQEKVFQSFKFLDVIEFYIIKTMKIIAMNI